MAYNKVLSPYNTNCETPRFPLTRHPIDNMGDHGSPRLADPLAPRLLGARSIERDKAQGNPQKWHEYK